MSGAHSPRLVLVHMAPESPKRAAPKRKPCHLSVFRQWIEQMTLAMVELEARLVTSRDFRAHQRFRQLRRRFIRVQNEAYLCCVTMESKGSELRRDRAAYRIPRLMWMMIQIRRAAEAALDPA